MVGKLFLFDTTFLDDKFKEAREKERQRLLRMRRATEKAGKGLIKKLELKKGKKYILFIPKSAGLTPEDVESIDFRFISLGFLVETTEGIIAVEHEEKEIT